MERPKTRIAFTALFALLLGTAGLFCVFSAPLAKSAGKTLSMCASSIVPSLFPFMVISSLLTQSAPYLFGGSGKRIAAFDLPSSSFIAVILGATCGFPMGVVTAAGLKRRSLLTKNQAKRLAAVSNNAGPAFVTEVIGASFWRSRAFGIRLYIIQIVCSLVLGALFLALTARRKKTDGEEPKSDPATVVPGKARLTVIFTEAIGQATLGVIRICGFVVFFSVLTDGAAIIFPSLPKVVLTAFSCVLEFTSGSRLAASLGGRIGTAMCGFAVGFSGVSVLAQSAAFAYSEGISMKPTFVFKLCEGVLCALLAYFII